MGRLAGFRNREVARRLRTLGFDSTARAQAVPRFGVIRKPDGKLRSRITRAVWRRDAPRHSPRSWNSSERFSASLNWRVARSLILNCGGAPSLMPFKGGVLGLLVLEQFFLSPKKRFQFGSHRSRALM